MGQLAANTITRPIAFLDTVNGIDLVVVYECLAEVRELRPGRGLEAAQVKLHRGFDFRIWATVAYTPVVSAVIRYENATYAIQGLSYVDNTERKWVITATQTV